MVQLPKQVNHWEYNHFHLTINSANSAERYAGHWIVSTDNFRSERRIDPLHILTFAECESGDFKQFLSYCIGTWQTFLNWIHFIVLLNFDNFIWNEAFYKTKLIIITFETILLHGVLLVFHKKMTTSWFSSIMRSNCLKENIYWNFILLHAFIGWIFKVWCSSINCFKFNQ